ncbi:MAG: glycosyltransferase [Bacteroidetes bacterium]|nr:MAG: glycosyltransferase [Bacteroidota bacterium]
MKIVHLILGKARLNRMNGVNQVAHHLAAHQAALGHEVWIWGITPTPRQQVESRPYQLRLFRAHRSKFVLDAKLRQAIGELAGSDCCVHLHGSFIPEFYLLGRMLRLRGIKYVYCPHGALSPGAMARKSLRKMLYFHLIEKQLLRHAHAVHFLGQLQYDHIDRYVQLAHKVCIPNGMELSALQYEPQPLSRPPGLLLSFCGRLDAHHKGLDLLLEGFAAYQHSGGNARLWIIGDGPDRPYLQAWARRLGIAESLHFWRSRYGSEKLNLLAHTDAFVHCSRYEGMPMSVLEAAGLGLPCLLSTPTNLASALASHKAGFHIHPNRPEMVAAALHEAEQAWESGQLAEMGKRARQLIAREYRWEHIAQKLIWLYSQPYQHVSNFDNISV